MKLNKMILASTVALAGLSMSPMAFAHEAKMTSDDTALVRQIRQDLTADTNLSACAQNIKIMAQNGKVTLKGKVNSETEKQSIYDKVSSEAGVSSVDSKLDVKNTEY